MNKSPCVPKRGHIDSSLFYSPLCKGGLEGIWEEKYESCKSIRVASGKG